MDKPAGPRQQPPDKRHAAYESIFGRPGPGPNYPLPPNVQPPYPAYPPQNQGFPYRQQSHYSNVDSRASFGSSYSGHQPYPNHTGPPPGPPPAGHLPPQGPQTFHAPYIQHPQINYEYPIHQGYQPIPPQAQTPFNYQGSLGPPNPQLTRARSVLSNGSPIVNGPMTPYQDPQEMIQASSSHSGITPAQLYQNQVQFNGGRHQPSPVPSYGPQQAEWNRHRSSPSEIHRRPSLTQSLHQNGGVSMRPSDAPRLGISLEHDEGRLGIDFGASGSGSNSDLATDDGESELPYARDDNPGTFTSFCTELRIL
ncbi:hypothetical protein FA15DRAFT_588828 [Coprinopsis marcescibilis]|uniref:Uncharacterized protein n=1 Tax=Coprinopsis marcescibilis TaxID=230819 RepID=A0A5C3L1W8_COPMA|nr:hypothetical protein FA15DRAFT_588828 [Coprinopsis marcescibilis]